MSGTCVLSGSVMCFKVSGVKGLGQAAAWKAFAFRLGRWQTQGTDVMCFPRVMFFCITQEPLGVRHNPGYCGYGTQVPQLT